MDLPSEQQRGAAFDVFAEAWLATQRIPQAREVWPGNTAPLVLQQRLRLPLRDMGVDGIFEINDEAPTCYQVKFRGNRPSLSWSELSTFFGLADSGCNRLVFTNTDAIADTATERRSVVFVRGVDLDGLDHDDFRVLEAWLAGAVVKRKPKTPKPHQWTAVDRITEAFSRYPRTTALLACGTGKTLIALWVAERLNAKTILVLLPSLALVRQTLHEWLRETNLPDVEYRCVCSDASVQTEEDSLIVRQTDLDFRVTTDPASIRRFLEKPSNAVRIVFSTYQSSHIVGEAVKGLPPFDLGIFDEAHKTAGRDGAKFAYALHDERLGIARRLFMTATPRHYDFSIRNRTGDIDLVYSMDDPSVYGHVAYRLPFSEAARLGIITEYKVIISIVTSQMVSDELLRRGVVLIAGEEVKARQVANQIALKSAIDQYGVSRIFTFHSKVDSAKSFVSEGPEGILVHLPDFHCQHINGAMPTALRERLMREFANAPRAVMSNARCLTEGVDVPAVDMVAFLSPRRSLVDIVQATGRAMRRIEGKEFGYVLVPLYVEQARGESVDEAVLRSDFDEIWNVLNRLQEHDDLLAQVIAEMRIQRGKTGGYDDARFRDKVHVISPSLSLENLRDSITAACLDAIGDNWFERYGQLVTYREKHRDCNVPARRKPLGTWVVNQRVMWKDGLLPEDRIALLDRLGFNWDPKGSAWRTHYLALVEYKRLNEHCRVPENWPENRKLAKWVKTQRTRKRRNQLSKPRIATLDEIGFEWEVDRGTWDTRYQELVEYRNRFGDCRVPVRWPENRTLGMWVVSQRYAKRKGELDAEHVERLDRLGFEWEVVPNAAQTWDKHFNRLLSYYAENGHIEVGKDTPEDRSLGRWLRLQCKLFATGDLPHEHEEKFESAGLSLLTSGGAVRSTARREKSRPSPQVRTDEFDEFPWDVFYPRLVEYFTIHGTSNVPSDWAADSLLARWVIVLRASKGSGRLSAEQIQRLDHLGFAWTAHEADWDSMLAELATLMKAQGRSGGSTRRPTAELRRWMLTQRQFKKRGILPPNRQRKLETLGFVWAPFDRQWEEMIQQLAVYRSEYSDCNVPTGWQKNPRLARWVQTQRARKLNGQLSEDRIAALDALQFSWSLGRRGGRSSKDAWSVMYQQLQGYHAKTGSANVPQVYPDNQKLGWWVTTQRRNRRKSRLTSEQITLLDALKLDWQPLPGTTRAPGTEPGPYASQSDDHIFQKRWLRRFDELSKYREEHGSCRVPAGWDQNPQLANWVGVQRRQYKFGELSQKRLEMLNSVGFDWVVDQGSSPKRSSSSVMNSEQRWNEMFAQLEEYKHAHRDCLVPQRWPENKALAGWVSKQRILRNNGELSLECERRLNDIGFAWDPISDRWEFWYSKLVSFKQKHGHTNVSQHDRENAGLATWVRNQRRDKMLNRPVMKDRAPRLDALGFSWRLVEVNPWETNFEALVNFKRENNHCNVPQKGGQYRRLGKWVNTQRTHYKRGTIKPERVQLLSELGFVWNTKASKL